MDLTKRELEYYKQVTEVREKEVEELRGLQSNNDEECRLLRSELETLRVINQNLEKNMKEQLREVAEQQNCRKNVEEKLEKSTKTLKDKEKKIVQLIKDNQDMQQNVAKLENELESNKSFIEVKNAELKGQLESCR